MVLNNLAHQFGTQVAVISIYTSGGSPPFYNSTAYQKIYNYPPPYWLSGNWYFATPWLWVDGDKSPAYITNTWSNHISQRMQAQSDVDIHIYQEPGGGGFSLNMQIEVNNEGSNPVTGNLHCVLTENGIQWAAPNGQQIHNHVPRIWWPDQNGMSLTIPSGNGTTIPVNWTLQPSWNTDSLWVVAYLQSNTMLPDSTIEILQGASVKLTDIPTGIENTENEVVPDFQLSQNYPNPFNPVTTIQFGVPEDTHVQIDLFNISGQKVASLLDEYKQAGYHSIDFDGSQLTSGVYFYSIKAGGFKQVRKMILMK